MPRRFCRQRFHRIVYIFALCLLGMSLPCSKAMMSMTLALLAANWVIEGNWRRKFADFRTNYLLHAYLAFALVALLGILWTSNHAYGLHMLRTYLPLLALPTIVLTSPPLRPNHAMRIVWLYVATVVVVSIIGLVRYLTIPDLPHRQIVPYISHIRFALNVCLSICVLLGIAFQPAYHHYRRHAENDTEKLKQKPADLLQVLSNAMLISPDHRRFDWVTYVCLALVAWLLCFLLLLQSFTAFVVLMLTALTMTIVYWKRVYVQRFKGLILSLWIVIFATLSLTIGVNVYQYYKLSPLAKAPLAAHTANGRPYQHARDGRIENGNYINDYICYEELANEWNKRSTIHIDSIGTSGYTIGSTLIRYLNSHGLTKDSAGVAQLSPTDIDAVQRGVANPILEQRSVKRMVYVMLFEYEAYRTGSSVVHQSMLQRLEVWKAGWKIFLDNPLLGVGTGDIADAMAAELEREHSALAGSGKQIHSQYLSVLATFGITGFLLLAFFFLRAFVKEHMHMPPILLAYTCIVLVSFLNENTLDTLAGALFACYFTCLFVRQKRGTGTKP